MIHIVFLRTQTKGDYCWIKLCVDFSNIRHSTRFHTGTTSIWIICPYASNTLLWPYLPTLVNYFFVLIIERHVPVWIYNMQETSSLNGHRTEEWILLFENVINKVDEFHCIQIYHGRSTPEYNPQPWYASLVVRLWLKKPRAWVV